MSLFDLATTSFSSAHDADLPPSAFELRHVLLDHQSVDTINETIDDTTSIAQLRHVSYIAQNIIRLQWELERHQTEERDLYDHIMKHDEFRYALQPVVHDYRRRTRAKGFHPYHNRPLSPTPPPSSSSSGSLKDQPPSPKSQKSARSPPSSTASSTSYSSGMSLIDAYLEQERQQQLPGSSTRNPIVIEVSDKEEKPTTPPRQPSSAAYHIRPSMAPTYQPVCEKCQGFGHEKPDCKTPRQLLHCEFCAWLKQSQRLCTHSHMSNKKRRRLRKQCGLPEDSD
jgi:hypothetical protein